MSISWLPTIYLGVTFWPVIQQTKGTAAGKAEAVYSLRGAIEAVLLTLTLITLTLNPEP